MSNLKRKGIILAGGKGTRLWPITLGVSKQLLPLYNKPTIYYPLTTLMLSGIREYLIITTPSDVNNFKFLLGDGKKLVFHQIMRFKNLQMIAQAFTIGKNFIKDCPVALILGDNFFYGHELSKMLRMASEIEIGASIFASQVKDPERYGVVDFDNKMNVKSIIEKPLKPPTNYAITGLYFYDKNVVEFSKSLKTFPKRRA